MMKFMLKLLRHFLEILTGLDKFLYTAQMESFLYFYLQ